MEVDTGVECMETWEARAAELFTVCDRECKGFITKRDLQHLWGELPLDPDELESVFDSLDKDQNGFLSLQEFTNGFGTHLGLVIEFQADSSSNGSEGEEFLDAGEVGGNDNGGTEDCQLDGILSLLASQDLDSNSAVVEAVWQQIGGSGARMERLVAALLQELSRVKLEHGHLEAALATKTEQFNQQVSRLYEELETQISGEQVKAAQEHRQRGARVLATLEEEVAERDVALRALEEEQQGLRQRLEQAAAGEVIARQDNLCLEQHLKRVEEDLMRREAEVEELMQARDIHLRNTKNEKRRRAQQAFKVTEGIARERESLVTQLDLLRTINTQLRDEQDQTMPWSFRTRERADPTGGVEDDYCQSLPPPDLRGVACTSPPPRPPTSLPLLTTASSLHGSGGTASDCEHDEDFFSDTKVEVQKDSPSPTSPGGVSILQEILSQPALCVECGGTLPEPPTEHSALGTSTARPLLLRRQESFTQTSPTAETSPRSIETLVGVQDEFEDKEAPPTTKFADGSCNTEPKKLCCCNGRVKAATSSSHPWYSSSLVIFQPHHTTTHLEKEHHTTTHLKKPHHTTTHVQVVHQTLHTHRTHHTFHTSYTYFTPDVNSTTTRHTRSTQTVEQHTTAPQHTTPSQQHTSSQHHTAPQPHTAPQHTTPPQHHTPPQQHTPPHTASQETSTQHESTTPKRDIKLHQNYVTSKDSMTLTLKHHITSLKPPVASHSSLTHRSTSHDSTASQQSQGTAQNKNKTHTKYSNRQQHGGMKQHSNAEQYINALEQHKKQRDNSKQHRDAEQSIDTQAQHSDTKQHNNTQEQLTSSSKRSKTEQHISLQVDTQLRNTQKQGNTSSQRNKTEQHINTQHDDTQKHNTQKHDNTSSKQRKTEQHINIQQDDTQQPNTPQHNTLEQNNTSSKQSKTEQHIDTQKDTSEQHNNTQEQGNTSSEQNNTEQHIDKEQHKDTKQHTNNTQEPTTQDQSEKQEHTTNTSQPQHISNTQQPTTQDHSEKEEHITNNSQPQHTSNTQEPSVTPNQSNTTPNNTTPPPSTDTPIKQTDNETSKSDTELNNIEVEEPQTEPTTSSSSSRQENVTDLSMNVTSLLDTRKNTSRRNTPTLVVTPLRHHFPLDAAPHEENHKGKAGEELEEREKEEAKSDGSKAEASVSGSSLSTTADNLYCPTRMFKVVFIGDSGVGKTTFIHRASTGEYRRDFGSTVGVDYRTVEVRVEGVMAVLQLWDTAGQERFRSITRQYYRNADCVVVMYDLTSESTFLSVVDWISSIREAGSDGVMLAVVGNKEDLEDLRKVDLNEANSLAKTHSCYVCECSAARGSSVQEVLTDLTSLLLSGESLQASSNPIILLNHPPRAHKTCCKS